MIRFILPLFDQSEHESIRKLIHDVVGKCKICRKQARVSPKPGIQSKGLWPRQVNDIVCCDTFYLENIAVFHMLELFSGWSLFFVSENLDSHPTPDMTIDAFFVWLSIFGAAMKIYFMDQGPEFTDVKGGVMDMLRLHRVRVFQSPSQSPFTNPTERHNGLAKVYLRKIRAENPDSKFKRAVQEAQSIKNLTTRKHGFSAQYLAFMHPEINANTLAAGIEDLYIPADHNLSEHIAERIALRRSAQKIVAELSTTRRLQAALTKGMQGTVTSPLAPGDKVEYWAIPDGKHGNGYWLGPCTVVGLGGDGTHTTSKVYVIRRPNAQLTDAHRHRLRVIEPSDHVEIPVLGEPNTADAPAAAIAAEPELGNPAEAEAAQPGLGPAGVAFARSAAYVTNSGSPTSRDSKLVTWLYEQSQADGVTDNWLKPTAELIQQVDNAYGQSDTLLRVAFTRNPTRLRRLPRDLRVEDCGPRLTLGWDSKGNLRFYHWDSVDTVSPGNLRTKTGNGLAVGCTLLFARRTSTDSSDDDGPAAVAPVAPVAAAPPPAPVVPVPAPPMPDPAESTDPATVASPSSPEETSESPAPVLPVADADAAAPDEPDPAAPSTPPPIVGPPGPEQFQISTPPGEESPGTDSPSEASPARPIDSMETMLEQAKSIPYHTTRSGLSFNHRGPQFDTNFASATLTQAFGTFFATSPAESFPKGIDSPTLFTTSAFYSGIRDSTVPIFSAAESAWATQARANKAHLKEISRAAAVASPEFWDAMEKEVDQMLANGATFAWPPDGTFVFSSRWVFTWKPPPDSCAKARLVLRGFEEKYILDETGDAPATDSPTLQRDSVRLISHVGAQHRDWMFQSWDIRSAFQQTKTYFDPESVAGERLWLYPPSTFPKKDGIQHGQAMQLAEDSTHYGATSAPRRFYFFLRGVMEEEGFTVSKYDDCLFFLKGKTGRLHGIAGFHVDDGLLTGDRHFREAMDRVASRIQFGKRQETPFVFCGIRFVRHSDGTIELDQESAIDSLALIELAKGRSDSDPLAAEEVTAMRGRLGSILYISGNTRPFEAYAVSHLAGFTSAACVGHLRQINTLIKHMQSTRNFRLRYVPLHGPLIVYTFTDSNFKRERESGSQTGSLTFVGTPVSETGYIQWNLLRYSSRRTRRVVHSTLAAETLAASFSLDSNEGTRGRLAEVNCESDGVLISDCNSLYDQLYSMTSHPDEMLVPDFSQLRESCMPFRHALSPDFDGKAIELWWTPTDLQLADNLTKMRTPSTDRFFISLRDNGFYLEQYKRPRKAHRTLHALWAHMASFYVIQNVPGSDV